MLQFPLQGSLLTARTHLKKQNSEINYTFLFHLAAFIARSRHFFLLTKLHLGFDVFFFTSLVVHYVCMHIADPTEYTYITPLLCTNSLPNSSITHMHNKSHLNINFIFAQ